MSGVDDQIAALEALSDEAFLQQFRNSTLDKSFFNHIGHLRAGWLYLHQRGLERTCIEYPASIVRYATALGAPEKFNHTLTVALLRIMADRQRLAPALNWQSFVRREADLRKDAVAVLTAYYSPERLFSDQARSEVVDPDLSPLP